MNWTHCYYHRRGHLQAVFVPRVALRSFATTQHGCYHGGLNTQMQSPPPHRIESATSEIANRQEPEKPDDFTISSWAVSRNFEGNLL